MPVIINDLEVIVAPPDRPATAESEPEKPQESGRTLSPHELMSVLRKERERELRVRAH